MTTRNLVYKHKGKKLNLYFLNDIHLGAKSFEEEAFKNRVNEIKKDKQAVVILNGDYCDFIRKGDPRYEMDEVDPKYADIEDQYFGIKALLEPIGDKIIAVGMGNHDYTVKKYYGWHIPRMLAKEFGAIHFDDLLLVNFIVNKASHRVLVTHGVSGASTIGGQMNVLLKIANNMETSPDICVMGHVHRLDVLHNPKFDDNFKSSVKYIGITGTYLTGYPEGGSTYASRRLYSPNLIGTVMFELSADGDIDPKIIVEKIK